MIAADAEEANDLLVHAEKHLVSAKRLIADDRAGAYQLLYALREKQPQPTCSRLAIARNQTVRARMLPSSCTQRRHSWARLMPMR